MLKDKILAKLVAKYPGLPKEFLGFVAAKIATTTTEESAIDTAIGAVETATVNINDQAAFFQQESDRRVQAALAKAKADQPNPPGPVPPVVPAPAPGPTDPNAALFDLVKQLSAKVDDLSKGQQQKSMQERMNAKLGELKIPLQFAKGRVPQKEEEFDAIVAEIEGDFKAVQQHLVDSKLVTMTPPGGGEQTTVFADLTVKKADDDILAWSKKNEPIKKTI